VSRTGVDSLTPAEREVLRLVYDRVIETKKLARVLGKEPATVKAQIASAMRKLAVSSRQEAAGLLAEAEGRNPQGITPPRMIELPADPELSNTGQQGPVLPIVREERAVFEFGPAGDGSSELDRRINNLSAGLRVMVIAIIVIACAVVTLLLVPVSNRAEAVGAGITGR
jgi:DNA-binding CsgD family transcriptional regulator